MSLVLVDAGSIIAYFDRSDDWHECCSDFIDSFTGQFITTAAVVTEVMWHLRSDYRVQNEFLLRLSMQVFKDESMLPEDYARIAELNKQYSDLPADFADLSLVAVAERMGIDSVVTVDGDFHVYRIRQGHRKVALKNLLPT
jgi:Predicted nucleic acid-binding protein, contains PIN domain